MEVSVPKGNLVKRRILKAARRLFGQRPFDAVSVAELAAAARVNRAMLYYYYKNKEDLYRAVVDDVLGFVPDLWARPELREGTAAARLDAYIGLFVGALVAKRDAAALVVRELFSNGPAREYIFERYFLPNFAQVMKVVEDGVRSGEFAPVPAPFVVAAFMGGIVLPHLGMAAAGGYVSRVAAPFRLDEGYVDFYRSYVKRALAAAPAAPGG